jgi:hypothetical protein
MAKQVQSNHEHNVKEKGSEPLAILQEDQATYEIIDIFSERGLS